MSDFKNPAPGDFYCAYRPPGENAQWGLSCIGAYEKCVARAKEITTRDPAHTAMVIQVLLVARPGPTVWDTVAERRLAS